MRRPPFRPTLACALGAAVLMTGAWASPGERTQYTIEAGLEAMKGQPIDVAIRVLGLPDAERQIAGRKGYVWTATRCDVQILTDFAGLISEGRYIGRTKPCRWVYQAMVKHLEAQGLPYR
jgi:hypothetical protein